jgi:hypothetical protein
MRAPYWDPPDDIVRESWSINGEACFAGLTPPPPGYTRLAHKLWWMFRAVASNCRCTHRDIGALLVEYSGPKTPTALARTLKWNFDLALFDASLIRQRIRQRGGEPATSRWPTLWLEGTTPDVFLPGVPLDHRRPGLEKLILLAEERQVFVPTRSTKLAVSATRKWEDGLDVLNAVDEDAVAGALADDTPGYLANLFALVHRHPAGPPRPRPSLEQSYWRHVRLVAALSPSAEAKRLPVIWHALWRLPPSMTTVAPPGRPWLRYPAVSLVVGARPIRVGETG